MSERITLTALYDAYTSQPEAAGRDLLRHFLETSQATEGSLTFSPPVQRAMTLVIEQRIRLQGRL